MLLVGSHNACAGMAEAMAVLRGGGSALDAAETCVRAVESNLADTTVGKGGIPNLLGEVELDASIMDGRTLAAGAVGALRGFEHPISIARKVMTELPHVFLVGEGAERFAREMGFRPADLSTPEAQRVWREGMRALIDEGAPADATAPEVRMTEADSPAGRVGPAAYYADRGEYLEHMRRFARRLAQEPEVAQRLLGTDDPGKVFGTVNVVARDRDGHLACAVSTSGWAWKYPGRLGDSPVIGAGNYCDDRYGAAACTGRGEMAIRRGTARSAVLYLQLGMDVEAAGMRAMRDLEDLVDPFFGAFSLVIVDRDGNHRAFSNNPAAKYAYMTADMDEPAVAPRIHVALRPRTG